MRRLFVGPEARADIRDILSYSRKTSGKGARGRYYALIGMALAQVRAKPDGREVMRWSDGLHGLHLRQVRGRLPVKDPRHILIFLYDASEVRVLRVFHDAMDLPARLSDV